MAPAHGTWQRYSNAATKCRCGRCRAAWSAYYRAYRRRGKRTEDAVAREIARLDGVADERTVTVTLSALDLRLLIELQRQRALPRDEAISLLLRERAVRAAA